MKKKILSVLFIAVIAMVSMGFRTSSAGDDGSGLSALSIVKGKVLYGHNDRVEGVTFGIRGFKPGENEVTSVNIFDINGNLIGEVFDYEMENSHGAYWFEVEFEHMRVPAEFTIEVHVHLGNGSGVITLQNLSLAATETTPPPIDPDETILIVRYP